MSQRQLKTCPLDFCVTSEYETEEDSQSKRSETIQWIEVKSFAGSYETKYATKERFCDRKVG
jgi:hypothetical protein